MSRPMAAQIFTRLAVRNTARSDITAIAKPIAFRTSTRNRSVQGLTGQAKSHSWRRNRKARPSR